MALTVELTITNAIIVFVLYCAVKKALALYQQWRVDKMLEKYKNSPKDKVILHTVARCKKMPAISPFAMKLETYLRMAKIPYELETKDTLGPKGKLPWITLNGESMGDSQLIMQLLNKKFSVNLNQNVTDEKAAIARACRIVLEDHFLWGIMQFRWVENASSLHTLLKLPALVGKLTGTLIGYKVRNLMVSHGIGRHTRSEIYQLTEEDLRTLSSILGNEKFFGGESACEEDCGIFGGISQALWGMPGSSFERLVNGELTNLKQYAERMRDMYWPDWDQCIDRS